MRAAPRDDPDEGRLGDTPSAFADGRARRLRDVRVLDQSRRRRRQERRRAIPARKASGDPRDANLDRIQIIKGWVDESGKSHEKIYDVAWSGERSPDADGNIPAVGSTVDIETGRYTNTIGASELMAAWLTDLVHAVRR